MVCASQEAREALHTLRTVNTSFLSNLDYVCALTQALETTLQDTRLALALRGGSIHTHRNADAKQTRPACVSHLLPATSEEVSDEDKTDLSHPSHLSHQHLHHNVHTVMGALKAAHAKASLLSTTTHHLHTLQNELSLLKGQLQQSQEAAQESQEQLQESKQQLQECREELQECQDERALLRHELECSVASEKALQQKLVHQRGQLHESGGRHEADKHRLQRLVNTFTVNTSTVPPNSCSLPSSVAHQQTTVQQMQQKEAAHEEEKETHSRVPAELEATIQRHQRILFQSSFFQSSLELNDARRTFRLQEEQIRILQSQVRHGNSLTIPAILRVALDGAAAATHPAITPPRLGGHGKSVAHDGNSVTHCSESSISHSNSAIATYSRDTYSRDTNISAAHSDDGVGDKVLSMPAHREEEAPLCAHQASMQELQELQELLKQVAPLAYNRHSNTNTVLPLQPRAPGDAEPHCPSLSVSPFQNSCFKRPVAAERRGEGGGCTMSPSTASAAAGQEKAGEAHWRAPFYAGGRDADACSGATTSSALNGSWRLMGHRGQVVQSSGGVSPLVGTE
mmetsp:Transcript_18594/g.27316  ORF Transcript_18594/g.27316 Transcript_18594/m.27316 type:complete len:569 (+) Transcript_18594:454-2160(+)